MLRRIVENDRKKTRLQCEECGWESEWMPTHRAVEPSHECKRKQVKPVFTYNRSQPQNVRSTQGWFLSQLSTVIRSIFLPDGVAPRQVCQTVFAIKRE